MGVFEKSYFRIAEQRSGASPRSHPVAARRMRSLVLRALIAGLALAGLSAGPASAQTRDDLIFLHHSSGANWLEAGLHNALINKSYIDERNDITYGTDVAPDTGRPDSLGDTPGDNTDMCHWILWFNDYLTHVKTHGCANGSNRIIMFKSCFPASNISGAGSEPGDPFSSDQTLANYKAIYRHPSGGVYTNNGHVYQPLEASLPPTRMCSSFPSLHRHSIIPAPPTPKAAGRGNLTTG